MFNDSTNKTLVAELARHPGGDRSNNYYITKKYEIKVNDFDIIIKGG